MGTAPRYDPSEQSFSDLSGERVLVFGGTGFLGRHVCAALRSAGARVVTVSRNAPAGGTPDDSVPMDLASATEAELVRLVHDHAPRVVINAAGRAHGGEPSELLAVNAEAVERLAHALPAAPEPPRLVHLGSIHEYGTGEVGTGFLEDGPTRPVGAYAAAKLRATLAVIEAVRTRGLDGTVLRIGNVVGPGAPRQSLLGTVAHSLVEAAERARTSGERPRLRLTPLRAQRDFVDVRDVAEAVLAAATAPLASVRGRVVNVGCGRAIPVRQAVERMIALSGAPLDIVERASETGRSDPRWQRMDIGAAGELLSWRPRRDLERSLSDLLEEARRSRARRTAAE
ncbi:NAD-dependent epimerase/dehydratase family protein [Nocardiopsis alba]|uniref:NAD-dependent epimerase/dehydratase family protein n=1 Tax=Nocardiopsis alba TaxID=53437 RepID=A0A7K2IR49_9ACTN|nr:MULTISPECIES: NAD(P)-dependent oxidoreductase [Nocardiopsis]MEC3892620.1 NAD(P)-dependent oxidoreductase [Nocardiopsis sp. LDBS1602]MYR32450.1 NAD-dependent epimerase/dehydratase family protein [Nocardiopsis alba]